MPLQVAAIKLAYYVQIACSILDLQPVCLLKAEDNKGTLPDGAHTRTLLSCCLGQLSQLHHDPLMPDATASTWNNRTKNGMLREAVRSSGSYTNM